MLYRSHLFSTLAIAIKAMKSNYIKKVALNAIDPALETTLDNEYARGLMVGFQLAAEIALLKNPVNLVPSKN